MAFAGEQRQLGELGAEAAVVGSQAIGYAQKAVGVASAITSGVSLASGISAGQAVVGASVGGAVIGVSALALGVVGLALVVISVVYNLVMGNQAKVKMHRKMREAKREWLKDVGVYLIDSIYGMYIPDWTTWAVPEMGSGSAKAFTGEYYVLGSMFMGWSKMEEGTTQYESVRKDLVKWLRERGLDPTRFVGGNNVRDDEQLIPLSMFVALPEKILIVKEALVFLGYETSVVDYLDDDFLIRMFEMINAMGRVKTEDQAVLVKKDIEDWLMSRSLDPKIFFQKAAISVPSPVNTSVALVSEPLLLPGETAERLAISESKISPLLLIGLILGGVFVLSHGGKEF